MSPLGAKSTNRVVDHHEVMGFEVEGRNRAGVEEMEFGSYGWRCCEARRALNVKVSAKNNLRQMWNESGNYASRAQN